MSSYLPFNNTVHADILPLFPKFLDLPEDVQVIIILYSLGPAPHTLYEHMLPLNTPKQNPTLYPILHTLPLVSVNFNTICNSNVVWNLVSYLKAQDLDGEDPNYSVVFNYHLEDKMYELTKLSSSSDDPDYKMVLPSIKLLVKDTIESSYFSSPAFYMPVNLTQDVPVSLHLFEPRYKLLIKTVLEDWLAEYGRCFPAQPPANDDEDGEEMEHERDEGRPEFAEKWHKNSKIEREKIYQFEENVGRRRYSFQPEPSSESTPSSSSSSSSLSAAASAKASSPQKKTEAEEDCLRKYTNADGLQKMQEPKVYRPPPPQFIFIPSARIAKGSVCYIMDIASCYIHGDGAADVTMVPRIPCVLTDFKMREDEKGLLRVKAREVTMERIVKHHGLTRQFLFWRNAGGGGGL